MMNFQTKIRLSVIGIFILVTGAAVTTFSQVMPNAPFGIRDFKLGLDLQGGTHLVYQADISQTQPGDESSAVEGVRDVIERRVNAFGVAEPLVQTARVGEEWRVIVELAGVHDVNQAITMIGETPLLEFKEQNPNPQTELTPEQKQDMETFNSAVLEKANSVLEETKKSDADFVTLALQNSQDPSVSQNSGDLGFLPRGALVDEFQTVCFDDLATGEVSQDLIETQFGYHIIKKEEERGSGDEYEVRCSHILFGIKTHRDYIDPNDSWINTELTGTQLERAVVSFGQHTQEPEVSLDFNSEGADLFAEITKRNIGRPVAIFLDGEAISIPTVQTEITNGSAVISGQFTVSEAKLLSQRLNAGALPVPIHLISQQTVGSTLGQASLQKSMNAGLVGLAFVALFMILYYRLPGFIAVLALMSYALIVLSIFKLIGVTLTLSGVAGFILSLGLAVDANVLIFERLKEELRDGKTLDVAIKEGFKRAWPSIFDGNISTLITCFILIGFTTSLVKGFAITLSIGILVSMFSAVVITKMLLLVFTRVKIFTSPFLFGYKKEISK